MSTSSIAHKSLNQTGGARCSICGKVGVTKTTCPHKVNPKAKNPKPSKHNAVPLNINKSVQPTTATQTTPPTKITPPKKATRPKKAKKPTKAKPPKIPIVIVRHPLFRSRKKIAAFDYDGTLVIPKSKSSFSKNLDDWQWLRSNVVNILQKYYDNNFAIVIFTNQSRTFKAEQIQHVLDSTKIPYMAYIIYDKPLKKPNPHSFNMFSPPTSTGMPQFDPVSSFYCGDALGRHCDFAASDKDFAINSALQYVSPEAIFPFAPRINTPITPQLAQEIIVMVGYPGSGKSTYAKQISSPNGATVGDDRILNVIRGRCAWRVSSAGQHTADGLAVSKYELLNGDELKTGAKIVKAASIALNMGLSIVVDATNPTPKKRALYVELAQRYNIMIRCIHANTSFEESMYYNCTRAKPIPKIAFYVYRKHFVAPAIDEGFYVVNTLY